MLGGAPDATLMASSDGEGESLPVLSMKSRGPLTRPSIRSRAGRDGGGVQGMDGPGIIAIASGTMTGGLAVLANTGWHCGSALCPFRAPHEEEAESSTVTTGTGTGSAVGRADGRGAR
jgi:hypothetical protein